NEPRDIPGVIAPPPLIALAALLLGVALDWLLPSFILRAVFLLWTRLIIGAILIAAGAAMTIIAGRSFVQAGTNVEPWKPSLTLVTGGIFAWMRNPMYVGLDAGSCWARYRARVRLDPRSASPGGTNPAFLCGHAQERYLQKKFGESYRVYM